MFVRGDIVVIYGGYIDTSGKKTTVEIGTVVEAGRYELLVSLNARTWGGPVRVPSENCEKIEGKFSGMAKIPPPEIGDLVLVHKFDVVSGDIKKNIGTVQAIEMKARGCRVHVLLNGEIKKIAIEDCMVL